MVTNKTSNHGPVPNWRSSSPTDKTAHADADQKLADEAKGPGERLAASPRIDRLGWGAPRLHLIEPLANRVGASAKCLGLLGADFATSRAGALPFG